jgi:hypothetical protein
MNRIIKVISIYVTISLALPFIPVGSAEVLARGARGQEAYELSAEALEAAARFRNSSARVFADLELVLKGLEKPGGPPSPGWQVEYQPIPKRQLLDLLGPPPYEGEKDQIIYYHNYGSTAFYFESERLKNAVTLTEPSYWYSTPRAGVAKRLWYGTRRWTRKIIGLIF